MRPPNAFPARCSPLHEEESLPSIRWGLCCQFLDAPIKFRTATHRHVSRLAAEARRAYLSSVVSDNAAALRAAVEHCAALGIGAFRITSQFAPLMTHPESGYALLDLDDGAGIVARMREAGGLAAERGVRLSFHPDQFVVLNSERESVVDASLRELDAMAGVAEIVGADTLTLHGGGAAGGKEAALARLEHGIDRLGAAARARVALENDDRLFTPEDLLPFCARTGLAMVYDAHHHRCNPDALSVEEATARAVETWAGRDAALAPAAREPYFHVSSPRDGWDARNPRPHADYLDPADLPALWRDMTVTADVEAKAKERAVLAIKAEVEGVAAAPARG